MKKKIGIIIGILTGIVIFSALLMVNKRIVDQNAIITQAEINGDVSFQEVENDQDKNKGTDIKKSKEDIKDKDMKIPNTESQKKSEESFIEKVKAKIASLLGKDEEDYNNEIKISLVGDILFDGHIRNHIKKYGYDYPWDYISDYFTDDDISIGNLETTITRDGSPWPNKQFNFRSDPKNVRAMKKAGIDLVSLANNHTLDYGYEGLEDTINYLNEDQIKLVGAGRDIKEATKAVIIEKENTKIGILGYSRVAPDVGWWPNSDKAGVASAYDKHLSEVLENISEVRKEVDILIMLVHWGIELQEFPRESDVIAAKKMIDVGVDVVAGHHPHVLQGIEIYKGKPIFYSLGNFIFSSRSELTANTMIAQLNFNHRDLESVEVIPLHIVNSRPEKISEDKKNDKLEYLREISDGFDTIIDEDGKIIIEEYQ